MEETQVSNGDSTPKVSYHSEYTPHTKSEWKSNGITNLVKALCKFQGEIGSVSEERINPFFKSKYADINDILIMVRPVLSKHGLAISQGNRYDDGFYVATTLFHETGEWLRSEVRMPIGGKKDAHAVGGACTYGRRYGLLAILGLSVAGDDDDGNNASNTVK